MKIKVPSIVGICLIIFLAAQGLAQKRELPSSYKKWLEEEVVYIISPVEKDVFLKLQSDRERDLFIEAFWKHRDPTPGSSGNEFKTEHYRRISHANHFYGRTEAKPGWKTDRGRVYILLGEPNDIQRFEGKTMTYPAEVWFYQGKTELGLPPGFNLVFFQEGGTGEYKIYSPLQDGPQALMTSYAGDPADYLTAYQQLREFEPSLADVSLSLIPGEESATMGRPSLASDLLLQKVETVPLSQLKEKYAQKFLQYKDLVEVEYTANYIDNDSLVKVIRDASGIYFVHIALEPERLSVNAYEKKYYTTFKLNGAVTDSEGKVIFQFERTISVDLDEEKMGAVSRQPFNIHDMFPLIPGNYKLSLLLRNEVSKEFTSVEQALSVPAPDAGLQMSSLLLGYKIAESRPAEGRLKPFLFGTRQVYFQPNRVFLRQDNLIVAFQVNGFDEDARSRAELKYTISRDEEIIRTIAKKASEYGELPDIIEEFSLADLLPAHYRISVVVLLDGREVLSEREEFDVTHAASIPRPWISSKLILQSGDPVYSYLIGSQLFNSGRIKESLASLEEAFRRKPDSPDFALSLARALLALGDYARIEPILLPFVDLPQAPPYDLYFLLGKALQAAGQLSRAVEIFDKAVSHYGVNTNLLNSIGECYFQMGKAQEALVVWEKSLELSPNQPQIRKAVEALKEKK
jgi:GWxTD domain-containing protein